MKVVLLLALGLLVLGPLADSGRILRTWRRRHGGRSGRLTPFRPPMMLRRSHYTSPWTYFRRPRTIGQQGVDGTEKRNQFQYGHGYHKERERHHGFNPIPRDPTTHYAPPSEDEINLGSITGRRNIGGHVRKFRPWRRPPPPVTHISLWKLLSMHHRRRFGPPRRPFPRPPPPRHQRPYDVNSEEAEITPVLPNFVYFLPKDIVPGQKSNVTKGVSESGDLKPGFVSDVPLYPTEATSASEFKPVTSRDYLMKVVEVRRPHGSTLLLKSPSTTASSDSTLRSAPAPENLDIGLESTESLLNELLQEPPSPINSFNINIDAMAEGTDAFIKVAPSSFVETFAHPPSTASTTSTSTTRNPPTTSITTTVASSTTTMGSSTSTFKPMFAVRVVMPPANPKETEDSEEKVPSTKEPGLITNSKESKSGVTSSKELKTNSKESKLGGITSSKEQIIREIKPFSTIVYNSKEKVVSGKEELEIGGEESDQATNQKEETPTTKAPPKPAPAYKWPTMKPYIKSVKKQPQVSTLAKVSSSVVSKSSSSSGTASTSSESSSISITGIRSRVKEYKPSVLPTSPGLLIFDKVDTSAEVTGGKGSSTTTSSTSSPPLEKAPKEESSVGVKSTVSPMQNFDPMKMIHSWLTKTKPS